MSNPIWRFFEILRDHKSRAGWRGILEFHSKLYWGKIASHSGQNIFERDWDVMVILDACRYDLATEIAPEYDFFTVSERFNSLNSSTWRWMEETFTKQYRDELRDTIYVCGNPFSKRILNHSQFKDVIEPWRSEWEDEQGTIPPEPITNHAIKVGREKSPQRLIVHYMQPHTPFIGAGETQDKSSSEFGRGELSVWDDLQKGITDRDTVWRHYGDTLRLVLDEVDVLLENIDAEKVVLSSDHGNAIGEYGLYGHPPDLALGELREVPLAVTSATDEKTRSVTELRRDVDVSDDNLESRLEALGYR